MFRLRMNESQAPLPTDSGIWAHVFENEKEPGVIGRATMPNNPNPRRNLLQLRIDAQSNLTEKKKKKSVVLVEEKTEAIAEDEKDLRPGQYSGFVYYKKQM